MTADVDDRRQMVSFVRLFTDSARQIYGYILVLLPSEDAAGDVFQEVSVTLWERFDQFELGTDFYAWAKQVAYFKVLSYRKQKRRERIFLGDTVLDDLVAEADQLSDLLGERHRAVADCYAKLSRQDRDLIARRYARGASVENIADRLGRSVHSVYRALRRVRHGLYDCVTRAIAKEADA